MVLGHPQAAEALIAMQDLVRETVSQDRDTVGPAELTAQIRLYRSAAMAGTSQTAARSVPLKRKHNALARRLVDRQDDYLRFTRDWRVPPDNNGSERDIGVAKLRQKVSGCLRTLTGAPARLRVSRRRSSWSLRLRSFASFLPPATPVRRDR